MATMMAMDKIALSGERLSPEEEAKIVAALDFYLAEIARMQRESQETQSRMTANLAETRAIIAQINAMLPLK